MFHVLNRANARADIFGSAGDYRAFERIVAETCERVGMRVLSYCVMPSHWHFVLWPRNDGDMGVFMHRLTVTHVRRWHLFHGTVGMGHLYQGTYKSFPVQQDNYFLTACRYVERNALTAGLVERAEDWPMCSLWLRANPDLGTDRPPLTEWPVPRSDDWIDLVNRPMTDKELEAVQRSLTRGRPFGDGRWQRRTADQLGLQATLRSRGRPRKKPDAEKGT